MTKADVEAHQRKHGFMPIPIHTDKWAGIDVATPKDRMNKTEREYSVILEAMKRRDDSDIARYKFEGISLSWGTDPSTGKLMWYTPDFVIFRASIRAGAYLIEFHEVKGGHIRDRDLVRFKGCRSEWPQFAFQMHQKKGGRWRRIH